MRTLLLSATAAGLALLFAGCHSQRQVTQEQAVSVDSLARSASHRTIERIDSAVARLNLSFDTLEVSVERQFADCPETLRFRAVRGQLAATTDTHKQLVEAHTRLDTVAYKLSSAGSSYEHTATTKVYDPPNTTGLLLLAILLLGALAYLIIRKKI